MSEKNRKDGAAETPEQEQVQQALRHENHPKPVTRRDFMAQGLIAASAFATLPSVLSLLTVRRALGADAEACKELLSTGAGGMIPFLVFDCAGGAALFSNWVPHLDESQSTRLSSYSSLGLGNNPSEFVADNSMGAVMAAGARFVTAANTSGGSMVRQGILNTTTPEARANLRMGIICHFGLSDSDDNTHNALQMISAAGLQGNLIKIGLGTQPTVSGTNSRVPVDTATLRPLKIGSVTDLTGALGYGATLQALPKGALDALAKALSRFSDSQTAELSRMHLGSQFSTLAQCGILKNRDYTAAPTGVDPRQDATMQSVYGLTTGSVANSADVIRATIVMNVLKGNSGPGAIMINGCDYHTGNQTTGDAKDLELGMQIGRAVQAAHAMGKPLMFQVITDGGIASTNDTRNWASDSNERSLTVVGFYNPSGPVSLRRPQVGSYTNGQAAKSTTLVGKSLNTVAASVLADYLTLSNKMSLMSKLLPPSSLPISQVDQIIHFG